MVHLREHLKEEEEGKAFKEVEVKDLLICDLDTKNTLLCSSDCWTTVIRLDKSSANSGTVTLLYTFCVFLSSRYTPAQPSLSYLSVPLSSPWWLNVCGEFGACICKCTAHSEIPIDSSPRVHLPGQRSREMHSIYLSGSNEEREARGVIKHALICLPLTHTHIHKTKATNQIKAGLHYCLTKSQQTSIRLDTGEKVQTHLE